MRSAGWAWLPLESGHIDPAGSSWPAGALWPGGAAEGLAPATCREPALFRRPGGRRASRWPRLQLGPVPCGRAAPRGCVGAAGQPLAAVAAWASALRPGRTARVRGGGDRAERGSVASPLLPPCVRPRGASWLACRPSMRTLPGSIAGPMGAPARCPQQAPGQAGRVGRVAWLPARPAERSGL